MYLYFVKLVTYYIILIKRKLFDISMKGLAVAKVKNSSVKDKLSNYLTMPPRIAQE